MSSLLIQATLANKDGVGTRKNSAHPCSLTTGAMVLGSVPLAIAAGAGAESRQAIGWVIVGDILVGTFFTLFVVPTAYLMLARTRRPHRADGKIKPDPVPAE